MVDIFEDNRYVHTKIILSDKIYYSSDFISECIIMKNGYENIELKINVDAVLAIRSEDYGDHKRFQFNYKTKKLVFLQPMNKNEILHFVCYDPKMRKKKIERINVSSGI